MELIKQVTSLELSKKLMELGVPQHSCFYWNCKDEKVVYNKHLGVAPIDFGRGYVSAFTVAELGEMLPDSITENGQTALLETRRCNGGWYIRYITIYRNSVIIPAHRQLIGDPNETEADARAKMLIYLIENKLISL